MKLRSRRLRLDQLEDRVVPSAPGDIDWVRQFGSTVGASAQFGTVAVDSDGNAYLAGQAAGSIPGQTGAGDFDACVRKYDAAGNELWTRQFGTPNRDSVRAVAVDASGVYVAGFVTFGALPGQTAGGGQDAFLRKYDAAGNELWTRQFGTATVDAANGVAVRLGRLRERLHEGILGGARSTPNQFVQYGLSSSGWTRQFNTTTTALPRIGRSRFGERIRSLRRGHPGQTALRVDTTSMASIGPDRSAPSRVPGVAADARGVYVVGALASALCRVRPTSDRAMRSSKVRRQRHRGRTRSSAPPPAMRIGVARTRRESTWPGRSRPDQPPEDAFVQVRHQLTEVWTRQFGSPIRYRPGHRGRRRGRLQPVPSGTIGRPASESQRVPAYDTEGRVGRASSAAESVTDLRRGRRQQFMSPANSVACSRARPSP